MSDQKTAYPLCWPEGWVRTKLQAFSKFSKHSMEEACDCLQNELYRLRGTNAILSCNLQRRMDGRPYSNQAQPQDTGVAIYFTLKGKRVSLACDKWNRVECNTWSIYKHIEALRGQERWGVGSIEQAFRGYMALPAIGQTSGSNWWDTLGVHVNADEATVKEAFRLLARKHHPDVGGDPEYFRRITAAYEQFGKQLAQAKA